MPLNCSVLNCSVFKTQTQLNRKHFMNRSVLVPLSFWVTSGLVCQCHFRVKFGSLQVFQCFCEFSVFLGLSPSTVGSLDWFPEWLRIHAHRFSWWLCKPSSETSKDCRRVLLVLPIGIWNGSDWRHLGFPNRSSNHTRRFSVLANQNRTITIASDFRVDGAKSPEIPQKEGGLGLRNRSPKSQIASDFPSHP